jgi:cell division septation protein DedD
MPVALRDLLRRYWTLRRGRRICALGLGALLVFAGPAAAQESAATSALKNGTASYAAGKYENAVRQLTAAINTDTLGPDNAAKALYLRGMAYRKINESSRAISDLGAALWLGLPASDALSAKVNRALCFRAAGLGTEADAEIASARKASSNSQVDALLAENGGAVDASMAAFTTEVRVESQAPAPAPQPTRTADASAQWTTSVANTPAPLPPAPEKPTPPTAGWDTAVATSEGTPPASGGGNRLTRWWGSLRSRDEAAPAPNSSESNAPQQAPSANWATETKTAAATPTAEPSAAPPPAAPSGYLLQLTASRSEEEARQLWQQVSGQHKEFAGRQPLIEKTDIGNLGTFYRLQIGPFPDKGESLKLCNELKQSGVDCFLVTR